MKRVLCLLVTALSLAAIPLSAQSAPSAQSVSTGTHYELRSTLSGSEIQPILKELDLRFEAYNRLFRFAPGTDAAKLKVQVFATKSDFDTYLKAALGYTRDGATYLHYSTPEKCELVLCKEGSVPIKGLAQQSFIQYLRSFIPNPPSWMREGFAIYFDTMTFNPQKNDLTYEENLAWLDAVKAWKKAAPGISGVLRADLPSGSETAAIAPDKLSPASWAFVSFLLNTENEQYRRSLYEAMLLLNPAASAQENSSVTASRIEQFTDQETLERDYATYLESRHTFAGLLDIGRKAYAEKDYPSAELAFMDASLLKTTNYAPLYYLGLLAYERKDYKQAESQYKAALALGADEALISYVLGVNAIADNRGADAKVALLRAKELAPAKYGAKADELLTRIK